MYLTAVTLQILANYVLLVALPLWLNVIFYSIADGQTAEDRMVRVVKFFLTSFGAGRRVSRVYLLPYLSCTFQCFLVELCCKETVQSNHRRVLRVLVQG